jgi:hypothetical protein
MNKILTAASLALSLFVVVPAHAGVLPVGGGLPVVRTPDVTGRYTAKNFGTLVLDANKTYELTGGCDQAPAIHCGAIFEIRGTYVVVPSRAPLFGAPELVLTDDGGHVTTYRVKMSTGDNTLTLTNVATNQKVVLDRVEVEE